MPFQWEVPLLVIAIVGAIVYFVGRTKRERDRRPAVPLTGTDLIERIQQTLGIAILVESVEQAEPPGAGTPVGAIRSGESTTIRASFMFGMHTTQVALTADSEAEAWEDLARAAAAWRNSDFQHVQMWPGAGG